MHKRAPDISEAAERVQAPRIAQLEALDATIRECTRCPLHESRKLAVPGEGRSNARVMIIGEAPGRQEDETGRPFIGSAGRYLDHGLEGAGLDRGGFLIIVT